MTYRLFLSVSLMNSITLPCLSLGHMLRFFFIFQWLSWENSLNNAALKVETRLVVFLRSEGQIFPKSGQMFKGVFVCGTIVCVLADFITYSLSPFFMFECCISFIQPENDILLVNWFWPCYILVDTIFRCNNQIKHNI
ncbi:hypothetical protein JOC94_003382 [Bacillus thermophilus]|uniref:Uncharacterized protein n=1 Tax=Siminovitchia thermophila TaxID=1245522 RepID=A0ABS2R9P6_9BACI|nr:hypothetical protein [Siminovitchia thermophila]